ncbi:MAG: metal-dependent hydrolase [Spongiibacteraceae bacterium]|nr:metal-dependent hydrolase [Spongiibacteraceae bacterium]
MSFYYGDDKISFERVPRAPGSKKVLIKVHPDCRVMVSAPEEAAHDDVLRAVKKKSRWLYKQLGDFRKQLQHVTPRKYVSGESHYYLGKQYQLKVNVNKHQMQGVKLLRGKLDVSVRQKNSNRVRDLVNDWYKSRAKEVFERRLDILLNYALWVEASPPLRVRTMEKQWGSCSPSGRLTLNVNLVKAPCECIDYVILHELCHIAEHNHSERFYRLIGQVMPNWAKAKDKLDRMVGKILTY